MSAIFRCRGLAALLFLAATPLAGAGALPEWQDVSVSSVNRMPARCDAMPLADVTAALSPDEPATPFVKSLNGRWKYAWVGSPARAPKDFFETSFDDSTWATIDVPSCVETRGYGMPMYLAHGYPGLPHPVVAGRLDSDFNPVSSYRTTFSVPADWQGREVYLRFEGVSSAFYFWVNGHRVGYSEDSKLPAEFNVTSFLVSGANTLAVQVFRFSVGSYLEDQDMIRFSGIIRSVKLYAEPKRAIRDFGVTTELSADFRRGEVKTDGPNPRLFDADGREVGLVLERPRLWSAEDPHLYTLVVSNGEDIRSCKVGFRRVERKGNTVLFNGRPIKYRGVNRHDHSVTNGRSVTRAEMLADVLLMKRHNIDTVRTCHYPNDPYWYRLCDRYGIYLVAEANVESHGMGQTPETGLGWKPEWKARIVERNLNQVANYRNHPSVFMWSLGNESGAGPAFEEAASKVRAADPTRLLHYEQANGLADVDSRMYMPVPWIRERGEFGEGRRTVLSRGRGRAGDQTPNKPFFSCEYAHAMGNAMGNFKDYWDAYYTSDSLLGGCVWDWIDQSLWKTVDRLGPDGRRIRHLAYAGDWDDVPNDAHVCQNGIVNALREVTPKLLETAHVHRQLVVTRENGKLVLENRFGFTPADAFDGSWELLEDGVVVRRGTFAVPPVAPLSKGEIGIDCGSPASGCEAFLNVSFALRQDTLWARRGHVIARNQIAWADGPGGSSRTAGIPPATDAQVVEDEGAVTVVADQTKAVFSKTTGTLAELSIGGRRILGDTDDGMVAGPRVTAVRAFVDNDTSLRPENSISIPFFAAGLTQLAYHQPRVTVLKAPSGAVTVRCEVAVDGTRDCGWSHTAEWTFLEGGGIRVLNRTVPHGKMPELPRFGLSWKLDGALEQVEWHGRGPHENYVDRNASAFVGRYASTVTDQYVAYVRPQDNGAKTDVRWVAFTDGEGRGVRFSSDRLLAFRAQHYDWEDLEFARHHRHQARILNVKPPRREVCLDLDIRQRGLGGASCGPKTLPEYAFKAAEETWTVLLEPYVR